MYVKLISSDGHEFIVKREHALTSGTIKAMLSGPGRNISLFSLNISFTCNVWWMYFCWIKLLITFKERDSNWTWHDWETVGSCRYLCSALYTLVSIRPNWLFCNRKDRFPRSVSTVSFFSTGLWWFVLLVTYYKVYLSNLPTAEYLFLHFLCLFEVICFSNFLEDWNFWSIW